MVSPFPDATAILALELPALATLWLMAIAIGLGVVGIWSRRRGRALSEWLALPVVIGTAFVLLIILEAGGWRGMPPTALLAYHLGGLLIPGVSAVWAYYGITDLTGHEPDDSESRGD